MSPGTSTKITATASDEPTESTVPHIITGAPYEPTAYRDPTAPPTQGDERTEYLAEPPTFELPADALGRGRPDAGALVHAITLPPSPDYTIRCPAHAHASSATVTELMLALASFRNRSDYHGELVVGDLSQHDGGRYGPHRSHQSGRDVDLWLPVRGGHYRRGCIHCGTDLCRPSPREVDWPATWQLVQALASRGAVQDIFLDWSLQPALRAAARQQGAPTTQLERQIQHPVRGRAALVKHAAGHIHHLHVRFRCPAHDPGCIASP
jgi:murein endopeptidase